MRADHGTQTASIWISQEQIALSTKHRAIRAGYSESSEVVANRVHVFVNMKKVNMNNITGTLKVTTLCQSSWMLT